MKKAFIYLTVLSLSIMLSTVVMAGSSAPKYLCYNWDRLAPVAVMTMKNQGTVQTSDGPVKYYSIHGSHLFYEWPAAPITGSATFKDGKLDFNHSAIGRYTTAPGSGTDFQLLTQGVFDTATGTGVMTFTYVYTPSDGSTVTSLSSDIAMTKVDCKLYSIGPLTLMEVPSSQGDSPVTTESLNGLTVK